MLCLRPEPCIVCKRSRRRKAAGAVDDRILPLLSFAKYSDRLGLRQTSAFTRRIDDRVCLYGRDMSRPFRHRESPTGIAHYILRTSVSRCFPEPATVECRDTIVSCSPADTRAKRPGPTEWSSVAYSSIAFSTSVRRGAGSLISRAACCPRGDIFFHVRRRMLISFASSCSSAKSAK